MSEGPLLAWMRDPVAGRGIHFSTREGGWHHRSYPELAADARRAAGRLTRAGVHPGDLVALVLPSGPAFVAAFFGALLVGAVPAPLAPEAAGRPVATGHQERMTALLTAARPRLVVGDAVGGARAAGVEALSGADLLAPGPDGPAPGEVEHDRTALVQFTSGSTGPARGVRIGWDGLCDNLAVIRTWLGVESTSIWASWLPVHHDMGLVGCLLGPVVAGNDLWLMRPEDFVRRPLEHLRCFGERGASITATPAFGLDHILRKVHPGQLIGLDLSAVTSMVVGAERMAPSLLDRFAALLAPHGFDRAALLPAYGLAEATLAVTGVRRGAGWGHRGPVVGCGTPLPGTTVRVVDEEGRPLPDGRVGEIIVRGPSLGLGHLGDEGAGSRFVDGELHTGDAGFLDSGELHVQGRLGDSVKVRGTRVFAEDLEQSLREAGVLPRGAAVVLGDDAAGPVAVAVIEADDGRRTTADDDRLARLLARGATGARTVVHLVPRGSIPWTSSGKPRRRSLWRAYCAAPPEPTRT
ncbi:AMP-binding protein [Streptomyces sp. MBT27]|uniref:AMP-binding protein n=1 Tax=Streptomyces sp. MBT27 TaxID=1488356 RepID=UPI0019652FFC|nr:AMP-binding protein [Streptomyces sp. MBT27]